MKIKGFDKNLCCRGVQFEIGKTYDTGAKDEDLKLCTDTVFHYCDSIRKAREFYPCGCGNRYCEVEVLGAEVKEKEKCGSNRIKILREIMGDELDILLGKINGNTGSFNSGRFNSGDFNNGDFNSGDFNNGDFNSGSYNSGRFNSGGHNSGDFNSGYFNNGDFNSGSYNSGRFNSGGHNSGDFNSCDFSAGIFCNKEENIRIFNKPSKLTATEFYKSEYWAALISAPFRTTEWVEYETTEMDTEDKKAMGGYLKTYTYKEACANWWAKMAEEDKEIIKSMPNFDKDVFKDITGIEV